MSTRDDVDLIRSLVQYVPETGELLWAQRSADAYPHSKNPESSARTFNTNYAGKPVTITLTAHNKKSVVLRNIPSKTRVCFDKLLWLAISGEWTTDDVVYLDNNTENLKLDNLVLMPTQAKQTKLDAQIGITTYTKGDRTLYRARLRGVDGANYSKADFSSSQDAYAWRVAKLKELGLWWVKRATNVFKDNPFNEEETS